MPTCRYHNRRTLAYTDARKGHTKSRFPTSYSYMYEAGKTIPAILSRSPTTERLLCGSVPSLPWSPQMQSC